MSLTLQDSQGGGYDFANAFVESLESHSYFEGILPCVTMAGRAPLAGYPRFEYLTGHCAAEFLPWYLSNMNTITVDWCIASKLKVPLIFFNGINQTFLWVDLSFLNQSYSSGITRTKKPTGYCRYYHSTCQPPLSCGLPGVHTMSDELILQISYDIFLAFKWILMMTSGQKHHIIRQLSYQFMCEIMTWSDDKTKLIHKYISARLRLRALEP